MQKIRVAVLRGGPSDRYDLSLLSGGNILKFLPSHYEGRDVFIDKSGVWHEHGVPVVPENILSRSDVVWNGLQGAYGADGTVQNIIRHFGIPYVGPEALPAAHSFHPDFRNDSCKKAGLKIPQRKRVVFDKNIEELALELFRSFPMPARIVFASPLHPAIEVVDFHSLHDALIRAESIPEKVFIEEKISGKHSGCGIIDGFRGQKHYALLPFEIKNGEERHPGKFAEHEKKGIENAAILAHKALGLRHYSVSHFVVHPKKGIYLLDVESLPSLHEDSKFMQSLHAVGATPALFADHILELVMNS